MKDYERVVIESNGEKRTLSEAVELVAAAFGWSKRKAKIELLKLAVTNRLKSEEVQ